MRAVPVLLIALLAAVLIAGCINKIASTQQYTQDYASGLSARVPVADSADATACKDAKCMCMVCKKGTTFFGFLTSFAGGNCYFKKPCTSTEIYDMAKGTSTSGKDLVPNYFRIGQGPSFADFGEANAYCNSRLGMAVQWLVGSKNEPYSLPTARRAVCLLDKGIMPVYVLYSNGENIDPVQTMKIAAVLGTEGDDVTAGKLTGAVGPVIVTTEINYDVSQAEKIKEQIRQINTGCRNDRKKNPPEIHCMVAVAPKLGDKDALAAVLSDPEIANQTDLVAYGIDSNRLNFKGYCNRPSIAWDNATAFSSYALYEWGKPSVIPYVLFDGAGTDANTDPATQCKWNEATMIEGYMQFFNSFVMTLPDKGVIGVAPYAFKSSAFPGSNPLGCADCDLGKNDYRKASWYAGCQAYTTLSLKATASTYQKGAPGTLLSFPDNPGSCQDSTADIYSLLTNREYQDKDFTQIRQPTLQEPQEVYLRCDECISNNMGDPPFKFPKKTVADLDTTCNKYPELDSFAGQRSLDPVFVRAVVATESINFNPCSAAKVCKGGYNDAGCFDSDSNTYDECYWKAYGSMSDPAAPPCPLTNAPNTGSSQPNWRWCGLGLMQSLEPPYTYWPARYSGDGKDGTNVAVFNDAWARGMDKMADMELAKACNPKNFNPFNPSDSACVGTAKLAQKMADARFRVAGYHNYKDLGGENILNWKPAEIDKENVFIAYIAANLYIGGDNWKNAWVEDFYVKGWSVTPELCTQDPTYEGCKGKGQPDTYNCYGITDPVEFIQCRIDRGATGYPLSDRGAAKMGVYYYLRDKCENSFCPDWKRLYDAAKWPGKPIVPIEDDPLSNPT